MKLLFCDNTIWGLCNFREPVFRHFHERGHDIVLVAPADEGSQMKANVPAYARHIPVHLARTGRNPLSDISYMRQLYSIYRRERPDYIFHYTIKPNIYGTLAARLCGIPSTAMVAGLGYMFQKRNVTGRLALGLYRFGLHYARHVFVLNQGNRDTLLKHHIASEDKLVLLKGGEGIDTSIIKEGNTHRGDKTTFLMVARALYDKGYAEFVEAARLLKDKRAEADFCLLGAIDEAYPNAVSKETMEADVQSGCIKYLGFTGGLRPRQTYHHHRHPGLPRDGRGREERLPRACQGCSGTGRGNDTISVTRRRRQGRDGTCQPHDGRRAFRHQSCDSGI